MLTITRRSVLSGTWHTMDVNLDNIQLWTWGTGTPLAEAAPQLTAVERRFLTLGITPEEETALAELY
jgi:hypothetical protein